MLKINSRKKTVISVVYSTSYLKRIFCPNIFVGGKIITWSMRRAFALE